MDQEDAVAGKEPPQAPDAAGVFGPRSRKQSTVSFQSATDTRRGSTSREKGKGKENDSKGRWLHKMTDWLAVSEPSAQALKNHRRDVFEKAGISKDDKDARAKLHVPVGEIPADAIRPSKGPDPEDVFKRQAQERKKAGKAARSQGGVGLGSQLSHSSSSRSSKTRVENPIFPFD
ncbi:hypothetical protein CONLIGDRAFT_626821 [Coniochaeta ligniaria NRRL 30616]|uniref:Uncharacterized protein n=1 Tax=Coniochaeta ligniaria NRRL 30616 TaxID=1408157 RepID=A0A1J7J5M8_9PEZI|nr:hypothetical protein CONLIGDRAFT_626821 [Coniochaeta ligniaria NRRL 30616]